jgi:L-malate glycosyltransferase
MPDKKLNVLFISSWYPNRVKPTLGNFVQKHVEASALFANVVALHVCFDEKVTGKKPEIVSTEINGVSTIYFYCKKSGNNLWRLIRFLKAYKTGMKMVEEVLGTPDIIHSNILFPVGLVFCFLRSYKKIPYVISENWTGYQPQTRTKLGLFEKYYSKKIAKKAALLLPVSIDLQNSMINLGMKGKYKVIPNVVDTDLFSANPNINNSEKKILHVSSFVDAHKNISGMMRVLKKLSEKRQDFTVHFISDGKKEPIIEQAKQLNLADKFVFFYGEKKTNEVAQMMQQSDFLLMFSNYENLPCVIVEAFSCGLPVVSSDVGGIPEIVSDQRGLLVKPKDEEALLAAINKMLDTYQAYDKNILHQYAENNFSYNSVGKQFMDTYSEIIKR